MGRGLWKFEKENGTSLGTGSRSCLDSCLASSLDSPWPPPVPVVTQSVSHKPVLKWFVTEPLRRSFWPSACAPWNFTLSLFEVSKRCCLWFQFLYFVGWDRMWQVAFIKILEEEATDCHKSDFVSIKVNRNHQFPLLPAKKDRSQKKRGERLDYEIANVATWGSQHMGAIHHCHSRHHRLSGRSRNFLLIKHGGGNQRRQGESNQPSIFWPAANYEKTFNDNQIKSLTAERFCECLSLAPKNTRWQLWSLLDHVLSFCFCL